MNFKLITILSLSLFIFSCQQPIEDKTNKINFEFDNRYRNSGFALIYNEKLNDKHREGDNSSYFTHTLYCQHLSYIASNYYSNFRYLMI